MRGIRSFPALDRAGPLALNVQSMAGITNLEHL